MICSLDIDGGAVTDAVTDTVQSIGLDLACPLELGLRSDGVDRLGNAKPPAAGPLLNGKPVAKVGKDTRNTPCGAGVLVGIPA